MRASGNLAQSQDDLGRAGVSEPSDTQPAGTGNGPQTPYDRIDYLAFLTALVVCRKSSDFENAIRLAYHAGASREELLTAVELGRVLGGVPDAVVVQASATVQAWDLMVARLVPAGQWPEPTT